LLLVPGVRRIPQELEQAARLDGCGWARLQWHVRRPAVAPYLALAWLVILILCFGEIGTTVLLHAPGGATAAISAYYALHKGVYADLAVLALLSAVVILLPWGLLVWWWRRATRAAREFV
jgi:ABC-type Fe3+ transport system permease subunit